METKYIQSATVLKYKYEVLVISATPCLHSWGKLKSTLIHKKSIILTFNLHFYSSIPFIHLQTVTTLLLVLMIGFQALHGITSSSILSS